MITAKAAARPWPPFGSDPVHAAFHAAHAGLDEAASARLNARLALMLASEISDAAVVTAVMARARAGLAPEVAPILKEAAK